MDKVKVSDQSKMDKVKISDRNVSPNKERMSSPKTSSHRKQSHQHKKCERREKLTPNTSGPPIIHPNVEHAQTSERRVFRLCEDSRPMFSPVPANGSDIEADDHVTTAVSSSPERPMFPAIHVERCESRQPCYSPSMSPQLPRHQHHQQCRSAGSGGGLNVPSPYLTCQTEGRVLLMTHTTNHRLLGSWSRSEGNLPEVVSRSPASPASHPHLLDIRYRPSWPTGCATVRTPRDASLHEMGTQRRGSPSPTRGSPIPTRGSPSPTRGSPISTRGSPSPTRLLPARLEPLNPPLGANHRALSASSLQTP